ncbi:MAG: ATP-dependent 6-phosphofructokinase [Burkholderiaceae bacterium]
MSFQARRIGILTGGGDCPGLNGVIAAVTRTARTRYGATVVGIEDGFEGLVEGRMRELDLADVVGILGQGGTILGTSNKGDPWHYPVEVGERRVEIQDVSYKALRNIARWNLDALVAVGGDGTMHIASRLMDAGIHVVGVPKTIDNDVPGTDTTFGFDTAVSVVCEALDRLATTASSHHRVMVVEVMGRYAGWIALMGGLAGGADVILMPEIAFTWESLFRRVNEQASHGKRYSIVCVAEGARLPDGSEVVRELDPKRTDAKQLGGIGAIVAREIEAGTGHETRVTVLAHLQRGGAPTAADRVLATGFGAAAARCVCEGEYGVMVAVREGGIVPVPMRDAIAPLRRVPLDHHVLMAARSVGIGFGDE